MANIELDGANKKIKVDSGDLTLDIPGDIILDADGADLVFADGGTNILKVTNSSSDVVFQPQVDAKDLKFNQYDGRTLLEVNDGGFVAIANGATGPGQLRLYEDTDNGTNYTAFQIGTQSGDITYTLPTADGSNGQVLSTNGSGTLSWGAAGGFTVSDITGATALDDVPATTDEFIISDAGSLKRIDANFIMNTPAFLTYKTGNTTFADSTFTTLVNTSIVQNDGTCYDDSNGRFTIPSGQDGTYYMYGSFRINNYDPNRCQGEFHVNGSSLGHSRQETVPQGDVSGRHPTVLSMMIMNLSATDYVEFKGYQSSGSSDTVFQSVFGGFKIR